MVHRHVHLRSHLVSLALRAWGNAWGVEPSIWILEKHREIDMCLGDGRCSRGMLTVLERRMKLLWGEASSYDAFAARGRRRQQLWEYVQGLPDGEFRSCSRPPDYGESVMDVARRDLYGELLAAEGLEVGS